MDSNIGKDDVIGYGIIDLDPYLNMLQVKDPELEKKGASDQTNNQPSGQPK